MKIKYTGHGLSVVICVTTQPEWLAFSCWHSLRRMLPEAKVSIIIPRSTSAFRWANRANVDRHRLSDLASCIGHPEATKLFWAYQSDFAQCPLLVLDANAICVRQLDPIIFNDLKTGKSEDDSVWFFDADIKSHVDNFFNQSILLNNTIRGLSVDCGKNDHSVFVSLKEKCGSFNINNAKPPFEMAKKFKTQNDSVNERLLIESWERTQKAYLLIS